ncbi:MAG: hypothetical protein K2N72_08560, partial [Oscillospiraceae bacterium]|nr:hypothetical protein [Oscillospiraceae bacterium]
WEVVPLDGNLQSFALSCISQTKSHFIQQATHNCLKSQVFQQLIHSNTKAVPRHVSGEKSHSPALEGKTAKRRLSAPYMQQSFSESIEKIFYKNARKRIQNATICIKTDLEKGKEG